MLAAQNIDEKTALKDVVESLRNRKKDVEPPKITDNEAAEFIVNLYDKKGAKAVDNLIERALLPKGKLLGYEKRMLKKHMVTERRVLRDLDRRQFMGTLGTIGGVMGLGSWALI